MPQLCVKKAITALYHNIIRTNAHKKHAETLRDIDIRVPFTPNLGMEIPGPLPEIDATAYAIITRSPLLTVDCSSVEYCPIFIARQHTDERY